MKFDSLPTTSLIWQDERLSENTLILFKASGSVTIECTEGKRHTKNFKFTTEKLNPRSDACHYHNYDEGWRKRYNTIWSF